MIVRQLLRRALPLALLASSSGASAATDWRVTSVELNPVRVMLSATSFATGSEEDERQLSLTGGLSIAGRSGRSEIAVPIGFMSTREDSSIIDTSYTLFEFDVQYRRFLSGTDRSGLYFGPLLHFSHTRGNERYADERRGVSTNRLGVGLVFGFRRSLRDDFYWGMAFSTGAFVAGEAGEELDTLLADPMTLGETTGSAFVDIELLKFGKRF